MKTIFLILAAALNITERSSKYLLVQIQDTNDNMIKPDNGENGKHWGRKLDLN